MLIVIISLLVAVGVGVIALGCIRQRSSSELQPDWWPEFERQFRAYDRQQRAPREQRSPAVKRSGRRHPGDAGGSPDLR